MTQECEKTGLCLYVILRMWENMKRSIRDGLRVGVGGDEVTEEGLGEEETEGKLC